MDGEEDGAAPRAPGRPARRGSAALAAQDPRPPAGPPPKGIVIIRRSRCQAMARQPALAPGGEQDDLGHGPVAGRTAAWQGRRQGGPAHAMTQPCPAQGCGSHTARWAEGAHGGLAGDVPRRTRSQRKAAGRALGTLADAAACRILRSTNLGESISTGPPLGGRAGPETARDAERAPRGIWGARAAAAPGISDHGLVATGAVRNAMRQIRGAGMWGPRSGAPLPKSAIRNPRHLGEGRNTELAASAAAAGRRRCRCRAHGRMRS